MMDCIYHGQWSRQEPDRSESDKRELIVALGLVCRSITKMIKSNESLQGSSTITDHLVLPTTKTRTFNIICSAQQKSRRVPVYQRVLW